VWGCSGRRKVSIAVISMEHTPYHERRSSAQALAGPGIAGPIDR